MINFSLYEFKMEKIYFIIYSTIKAKIKIL